MDRLNYVESKIVSLDEAKRRVNTWKMKDEPVVFTNGCFDIFHVGHLTYLAHAASLGKHLIVALNTDKSVRSQNKGEERPINPELARAMVIAGIGFVDLVIFFESDTPLDVIRELQPDILVKGADYDAEVTEPTNKKYIVGSDIVRQNGGKIITIPLVEGYSTTNILNKAKGV